MTTLISPRIFLAALVALTVSASAVAQANGEARIAVLDQEYVLFQSDAAKQATAELRQSFGGEERRVRQLEEEVTELRARLEADAGLLTENELTSLNLQIESKLREREELVRRLQSAQQNRRQAFLREYESVLTSVLEDIIVEQNIVLLMSAAEVIYARPELDITPLALDRFNAAIAAGAN